MRCEIDRGIFAELLAGVTNALPSKSAYPVLNNITLDVSNGKLALAGTDLDTYVRRTFALEGQSEDGTVVVLDAGDEFKILSTIRMGESPVRSSIAVAQGGLFIRAGMILYCVRKSGGGRLAELELKVACNDFNCGGRARLFPFSSSSHASA